MKILSSKKYKELVDSSNNAAQIIDMLVDHIYKMDKKFASADDHIGRLDKQTRDDGDFIKKQDERLNLVRANRDKLSAENIELRAKLDVLSSMSHTYKKLKKATAE